MTFEIGQIVQLNSSGGTSPEWRGVKGIIKAKKHNGTVYTVEFLQPHPKTFEKPFVANIEHQRLDLVENPIKTFRQTNPDLKKFI